MNKFSILIAISIAFSLMGCYPKEVSFTGDASFDETYLQPFLKQADAYGVRTHNYPLTVVYVEELENPDTPGEQIAGLSVLDDLTIYFNVNHEYWKNENSRKVLVYHELAHYLLSKIHIDISKSCDITFSIMSLWSEAYNPVQFEYWTSGDWYEFEDYYMEEIFRGSNVWKNYPPKPGLIYHEATSPCWN